MPDTIAAIATPQLPSAIGILRLSGPDTRRILDVVFSPAHGGPISGQAPGGWYWETYTTGRDAS